MSRECEGAVDDVGLLVYAAAAVGCSVCFCSVAVSRVGEDAAIDMGLLPRGVGLCCHFIVFEREGIAALGEGLGAVSEASAMRCADIGVEGTLARLIEPKPLNSGTSTELCLGASFWAMLASEADPMGASGDGDPNAASVLLGVCKLSPLLLLFREADGVSACCCCFSGEIDLARSVDQPHDQNSHPGRMQLIIFAHRTFHSPALRARRSCLPFSISSSNFRYRSLSSRSLFSDSSRTDFRNAAGSKSSSSVASSVVSVKIVFSCSADTASGECCDVRKDWSGRGAAAISTVEEESIINNNTAAQAGIRPREDERAAAVPRWMRV